jgi:dethiobiotin synthetase
VEGAGGLMVPLSSETLVVDLIEALELSVLLVARSGLGTINHTLLSLEYLKNRGIEVVGVVFNSEPSSSDLSVNYNVSTLAEWTDTPIWGMVDLIQKTKDREEVIQKIKDGIGKSADHFFKLETKVAI